MCLYLSVNICRITLSFCLAIIPLMPFMLMIQIKNFVHPLSSYMTSENDSLIFIYEIQIQEILDSMKFEVLK